MTVASGETRRAMVAATSGAPAVRAAVRVLRDGGSAVDAAIAAAMMQPVLAAGSWNSYAGILAVVCYDARTRRVHSLNAGYNTPTRERYPQSIPPPGRPSGRSALVPGFMAGIQAAHDRFGTVRFARLVEPAIDVAERGFRTPPWLGDLFAFRRSVLTRLPEGRRIFLDPKGKPLTTGARFRQRELADTLRQIARHGADYMYEGEWGRRFVSTVSREGGRITRTDLRRYRPIWAEPARTDYRGYDVCGPAPPGLGGLNTIEALKLLEHADIFDEAHYAKSARALYWLIQITHAAYRNRRSRAAHDVSRAAIGRLWRRMQRLGGSPLSMGGARHPLCHTDGVVAVDEAGNVASVCHSINTVAWGTSGIFVDGVSIPDSASFQQRDIQRTGPGARLPEWMNPTIVLKEGAPVLASTCIGFSLHEMTVQLLVDMLDFGLTPGRAVTMPHFLLPVPIGGRRTVGKSRRRGKTRKRALMKQVVQRGTFDANVVRGVRRMGQGLHVVGRHAPVGSWAGISIDRRQQKLRGAVSLEPAVNDGTVEGY